MAENILMASVILMLVGILLGSMRLVAGPSVIDRVVAMDYLTVVALSLIVFAAHFYGRFIYIDVGIVYALLSFLGVLAVARYLEGGL